MPLPGIRALHRTVGALVLASVLSLGDAQAAGFSLESSLLPAGGGPMQSGRFSVTGSAGQVVATSRVSVGTNLAERAGFWNRVSRWLPVLQVPLTMEAYPSTRRAVPGVRLYDLDAGSTSVDLRISVTNGVLFLSTAVPGGVGSGAVTGNGTGSLRILATATAIAETLKATGGLEYQPVANYLGPDAVAFRLEAPGLDPGGTLRADATVPITVRFRPTVVGRWVFYNQSAWDGNNAAANAADDGAVAPDKVALLPGGKAGYTNYTSYARGLNGVMVDISGVPLDQTPKASDFVFRTGNDNAPAGWSTAPAPISVTLRRGAGAGGSDRVTLIWGANAVKQAWLEIRVLATASTGLGVADLFYFGNAVGESGNAAGTDAVVNETDEILARQNGRGPFSPADLVFPYDYNRDRLVNATDQLIARLNATTGPAVLQLITPPAPSSGGALAGPAEPREIAVRLVAWRDAEGWVRLEATATELPDAEWRLEARTAADETGWAEVARAHSQDGRVTWRIQTDATRASEFYRAVSHVDRRTLR